MNDAVTYKDVPGFPGYRVGDDGSVWSCLTGHVGFLREWRQLRPTVRTGGYLKVTICHSEGTKRFYTTVHHLVLITFVGPRPPGMEACHEDDDKLNNRLSNLSWGTKSKNWHDRQRNGRHRKRLTADQVQEICRRVPGESVAVVAREFDVERQLIYDIVNGVTYRRLRDGANYQRRRTLTEGA